MFAAPQVAQDLDAVERGHLRVEPGAFDAHLRVVTGQILSHALGERRHERPFVLGRAQPDLVQQVVHLALDGPDLDRRIDQARRPDDLFDKLAVRFSELIRPRRGADVDHLVHAVFKLFKRQRPVVEGARQAETEVDEGLFAGAVPAPHAAQLGHGLVAFVGEDQMVGRQIVEQRGRGFSGQAPGEVARVVFDAMAVADGFHHLQVELGPLP